MTGGVRVRIDEFERTPNEALTADCCIVGTGPAGLTIARELAGSGLDVLLLESGGAGPEAGADELNAVEDVGAPRQPDQTLVRNRILGGTSHSWSGRAVELDPIDFTERDWVPHSGWPISRDSLAPYFERTCGHLGAPVPDNDDPAFVSSVTEGMPATDPELLRPYAWALSQDAANPRDAMRFGPRALAEPMDGVRCLLHATLVNIEHDAGRVTALVVADRDGVRRVVRARAVVLAGGAIENARLLLASRIGAPGSPVGRYLMDHLRGPVGAFPRRAHARLQRVFGNRLLPGGAQATPGYALGVAVQQREALTNCAAWLFPTTAPDDPFTAVAGARRAPGAAARAVLTGAPMLAEGAVRLTRLRRTPVRRLTALELHVIVEQRPDPDSRVLLADAVDRFGVPLSRIDWRIGEQERLTVRRTARFVVDALAAAGLPVPDLRPFALDADAPFELPDVAHPIGTTRMATDPVRGVVDPACTVHGVHNLFVAGSSVFPTGGHANPTQTIVALAVRLADHLRRTVPTLPPASAE